MGEWQALAQATPSMATAVATMTHGGRRSQPVTTEPRHATFSTLRYLRRSQQDAATTRLPKANQPPVTEYGTTMTVPTTEWRPPGGRGDGLFKAGNPGKWGRYVHPGDSLTAIEKIERFSSQSRLFEQALLRGKPEQSRPPKEQVIWMDEYEPESGIEEGVVWDTRDWHARESGVTPVVASSLANPPPCPLNTGFLHEALEQQLQGRRPDLPPVGFADQRSRRMLVTGVEHGSDVDRVTMLASHHRGVTTHHAQHMKDCTKQGKLGWRRIQGHDRPVFVPFRRHPQDVVYQEFRDKHRVTWNASHPKSRPGMAHISMNRSTDTSDDPEMKLVTVMQAATACAVIRASGMGVDSVSDDLTAAYKQHAVNTGDWWRQGTHGHDGYGATGVQEFGGTRAPNQFQMGGANSVVYMLNVCFDELERQLPRTEPLARKFIQARQVQFPSEPDQWRCFHTAMYLDDVNSQVMRGWLESYGCPRSELYAHVQEVVIWATGHAPNSKRMLGARIVYLGAQFDHDDMEVDIAEARRQRLGPIIAKMIDTTREPGQRVVYREEFQPLMHRLMNIALIRPAIRPVIGRLWAVMVGNQPRRKLVLSPERVEDLAQCLEEMMGGRPIPYLPIAPHMVLPGPFTAVQYTDASSPRKPPGVDGDEWFARLTMMSHCGGGGGWFFGQEPDTIEYFVRDWSPNEAFWLDILTLEMLVQAWCRCLVSQRSGTTAGEPGPKPRRLEFIDNQAGERIVRSNKSKSAGALAILSWAEPFSAGLEVCPVGIDSKDNEWADDVSRDAEAEFIEKVEATGLRPVKLTLPDGLNDVGWLISAVAQSGQRAA